MNRSRRSRGELGGQVRLVRALTLENFVQLGFKGVCEGKKGQQKTGGIFCNVSALSEPRTHTVLPPDSDFLRRVPLGYARTVVISRHGASVLLTHPVHRRSGQQEAERPTHVHASCNTGRAGGRCMQEGQEDNVRFAGVPCLSRAVSCERTLSFYHQD